MVKFKDVSMTLAIVLFVGHAFAATATTASNQQVAVDSADADVQAEVIKETPEPVTTGNNNSNSAGSSQEVYVIQQPTSAAAATSTTQSAPQTVVTQPTTVVEASPLVPSRAEEIRNARQRAEVETEQKIVEKLEQSRLEDEKKRMDRVFGNRLENPQEQAAAPVAAPEEKPQPQVIVVQQPQEPAAPAKSEEQLKSEIAESVKADLNKIKDEEKKDERRKFAIGAQVGTVKYDAKNVGSDFAGGVDLTWDLGNRLMLDGGFLYSRHIIDEDEFSYQDLDQYNWTVGLKYAFLNTRVTPVAGGLLSYTRRAYSVPYSSFGSDFSSDAIDAGLLIGVDIRLNETVALGIDYRRMMNVEARYSDEDLFNRPIFTSYYPGYTPLEEVDYDMLNIAVRFEF